MPEVIRFDRVTCGNLDAALRREWLETHGVGGRGFHSFDQAGYLLWRFWPDRARLPFMDIHQSGTKEDRTLTARSLTDPPSWRRLDAKHRFDYVLLPSRQTVGQRQLDVSTRAAARVGPAAGQQAVQSLLIQRAAAALPLGRRIGLQARGCQLAQDLVIGSGHTAWAIHVFDAHQPAPVVGAGVEPARQRCHQRTGVQRPGGLEGLARRGGRHPRLPPCVRW